MYTYSKEEKIKILTFYKQCTDMELKAVLRKILLAVGILYEVKA